jgi:hypothetical protein
MTRKPPKPVIAPTRKSAPRADAAAAPRAVAAAAASPPRKGGPLIAARRTGSAAVKAAEPHKPEAHKVDPHKKVAAAPLIKAAPAPLTKESAASHKKPAGVPAADSPARRAGGLPEDRQSQLKLLIARGKEQGYLTTRR